jgi:hypothetical protein
MDFASDITDRLQLRQYPRTCKCIGAPCIPTYEQRMRVRRSCIATVSNGSYSLYGTPTVDHGGYGYGVDDYLYLDDGIPKGQPALLRVTQITVGGAIVAVVVINAGPYMLPPSSYVVTSTTKSGSGYGATFDAVFIEKSTTCVTCGLPPTTTTATGGPTTTTTTGGPTTTTTTITPTTTTTTIPTPPFSFIHTPTLFGGSAKGAYQNNTYQFNNGWQQIFGLTPPPARIYPEIAYNGTQIVMYGGLDGSGTVLFDTWYLPLQPGGDWTQDTRAGPNITNPSMAYDGNKIIMFGGVTAQTWRWDSATGWTLSTVPIQPPARASASMTFYGTLVFMFGGEGGGGFYNDMWFWTSAGGWTQITYTAVGGTLTPRYGATIAFNGSALIMFGGIDGTGLLNETWEYEFKLRIWTLLPYSYPLGTAPAAQSSAPMIYYGPGNFILVAQGGDASSSTYPISTYTYTWTGTFWNIGPPVITTPSVINASAA